MYDLTACGFFSAPPKSTRDAAMGETTISVVIRSPAEYAVRRGGRPSFSLCCPPVPGAGRRQLAFGCGTYFLFVACHRTPGLLCNRRYVCSLYIHLPILSVHDSFLGPRKNSVAYRVAMQRLALHCSRDAPPSGDTEKFLESLGSFARE